MKKYEVALDPLGENNIGLLLLIGCPTGVHYWQQCGGLACEQREIEGFCVPLGQFSIENKLSDWFKDKGWDVQDLLEEKPHLLDEIDKIISEIIVFSVLLSPYGETHTLKLQIDKRKVKDIVEAWIPVITDEFSGVLTFKNSD